LVTAAILVIEIDEVLEAKMVSLGQILSSSLKILSLISAFSVAASTTKSAFIAPSFSVV